MTPIRRGTARRLGLRRPISFVIYDEAFGFKPDAWQGNLLTKYFQYTRYPDVPRVPPKFVPIQP